MTVAYYIIICHLYLTYNINIENKLERFIQHAFILLFFEMFCFYLLQINKKKTLFFRKYFYD